MNNKPVAWRTHYPSGWEYKDGNPPFELKGNSQLLYTYPVKELTDEEWNKAFDFYCETDEGVLKFDLELRDEWKKEQLIRWKEALRKAQKNERK